MKSCRKSESESLTCASVCILEADEKSPPAALGQPLPGSAWGGKVIELPYLYLPWIQYIPNVIISCSER